MFRLLSNTVLIVAILISTAFSNDAEHSFEKIVNREEVNGETVYSLKMEEVDYHLNKIAKHAGNYPPKFGNAQERKTLESELVTLINILKVLDSSLGNDPDFLYRYGWAVAMAHNLDLSVTAASEAEKIFERALLIDPDHVYSNFYYGHFLSSADPKKSIPYLERSIKNNINLAKFTLALVYVMEYGTQKADKDPETLKKAKNLLRDYLKQSSEDEEAKLLLKALDSGNLQYQHIVEEITVPHRLN